jgi:hypothetical protein
MNLHGTADNFKTLSTFIFDLRAVHPVYFPWRSLLKVTSDHAPTHIFESLLQLHKSNIRQLFQGFSSDGLWVCAKIDLE